MPPARQVLVVLVTCPGPAARRLAAGLIGQRLAACVNVVPRVESHFVWRGKTQRSREALLVIKTTAGRFDRLRRAVVRLHPDEVPEVIGLSLARGHAPYVRWIRESLGASGGRARRGRVGR